MVRSGLLRCDNTDEVEPTDESAAAHEVPWRWVHTQATAARFWVVVTLLHTLAGQVGVSSCRPLCPSHRLSHCVSSTVSPTVSLSPSLPLSPTVSLLTVSPTVSLSPSLSPSLPLSPTVSPSPPLPVPAGGPCAGGGAARPAARVRLGGDGAGGRGGGHPVHRAGGRRSARRSRCPRGGTALYPSLTSTAGCGRGTAMVGNRESGAPKDSRRTHTHLYAWPSLARGGVWAGWAWRVHTPTRVPQLHSTAPVCDLTLAAHLVGRWRRRAAQARLRRCARRC
jgi:hypothetical protein